jgi:rubredoxin
MNVQPTGRLSGTDSRRDDYGTGADAPSGILNYLGNPDSGMVMELDHHCRTCGEARTFWRVASTHLHLGEKTKWRCPECEFGFVRIDGIDSTADAPS